MGSTSSVTPLVNREPGPLLKGPGTTGVRAGVPHSDDYRHVDLEFGLNVDRADSVIADCSTGFASDPEEAVGQAVGAWTDTTACVAMEVREGRGRLARAPRWRLVVARLGFLADGSRSGNSIHSNADTEDAVVAGPAIDTSAVVADLHTLPGLVSRPRKVFTAIIGPLPCAVDRRPSLMERSWCPPGMAGGQAASAWSFR
jgi:hypothetical protein